MKEQAAAVVLLITLAGLGAARISRGTTPNRGGLADSVPTLAVPGAQSASANPAQTTHLFTDWSPTCPLELPSLEPPQLVNWVSCGAGCKVLRIEEGANLGVSPRWSLDENKQPLLAFSSIRVFQSGNGLKQWRVASAEGNVRFALQQRWQTAEPPGCTLVEEALDSRRVAFVVRGDGVGPALRSKADGLLIADLRRSSLRVAWRNDDAEVSSFALTPLGTLRHVAPTRRLELLQAETAEVIFDPAKDAERLPMAGNAPVGTPDALWFEVGHGLRRAVLRYSPASGATPLLRWPQGEQHAAGNLGSDGEWLVWTEGFGQAEPGRYAETQVMATPLGTAFAPRRVAADPNRTIGATPFVVGCGRAAQRSPGNVWVIDLQDGSSWSPPSEPGTRWGRPLGLTCNELWATAFRGSVTEIRRIQLPSRTPQIEGDISSSRP